MEQYTSPIKVSVGHVNKIISFTTTAWALQVANNDHTE